MLITQHSHWTPRSLEAPFQPGHSRILWLLVTPCRVSGSQGEVMEPHMGKRERGQKHLPPPPAKPARSLFLHPHHLVPSLVLARLSLPTGNHSFLVIRGHSQI